MSDWYELECVECHRMYAVLEPSAGEIEHAVCSSCRDSERLLGDDNN